LGEGTLENLWTAATMLMFELVPGLNVNFVKSKLYDINTDDMFFFSWNVDNVSQDTQNRALPLIVVQRDMQIIQQSWADVAGQEQGFTTVIFKQQKKKNNRIKCR
jgi:hypothetical protein